MSMAPAPPVAPGGLSRGHRVRQLVFELGRKAGCWETSLLSSDKNSSVFKARGRAALPAACGMRSLPPGLQETGRAAWPRGVCALDPPTNPASLLGHGAGGTVVRGLRGGALALPSAAFLHPQIRLGNV